MEITQIGSKGEQSDSFIPNIIKMYESNGAHKDLLFKVNSTREITHIGSKGEQPDSFMLPTFLT